MNRAWFDRAYADQIPATLPAVPDERLRALWECDDAARPVEEAFDTTGVFTVEPLGDQWVIRQNGGVPSPGSSFTLLKPYKSRDEAMTALKRYQATLAGARLFITVRESDDTQRIISLINSWRQAPTVQGLRDLEREFLNLSDDEGVNLVRRYMRSVSWNDGESVSDSWIEMRAALLSHVQQMRPTQEAIGFLNTFSTRGSTGVNMTVKKIGQGHFVLFTSGGIVDGVAYGTREEALVAAKRLAAEEGVRVEEGRRSQEIKNEMRQLKDEMKQNGIPITSVFNRQPSEQSHRYNSRLFSLKVELEKAEEDDAKQQPTAANIAAFVSQQGVDRDNLKYSSVLNALADRFNSANRSKITGDDVRKAVGA